MRRLAILNTHPVQYFAPLYRRLAQEPDLDLTVYYCSRQGIEEYFDEAFECRVRWDVPLTDGYRAKFLPNLWNTDRVAGFWSLINPRIIAELHTQPYDALLVPGHNHLSYIMGMLAAKLMGIPVFMRCDTHLLLRRSFFKSALRKPLLSFLYNRICTVCLDIGTRNREFYRYHKVPEEHLSLVPFAVDNGFFIQAAAEAVTNADTVRNQLGLPKGKPLILFVSKLTSRKRPMDLIAAFRRLQLAGIDAALVFVGSGELEPQIREYATIHKVEAVHLLGFQNQSALPQLYAAADVFVLPSEDEPWGLVLNEVMCAGLPVVVSSEVGAASDLVIDGLNGFLFDAGNVEQLTRHLSALLCSSQLRQEMGRESRRIIENWGYDECVKGIKKALNLTETSRVAVVQPECT